jgi:hypothetical protein
MIELSSSIVGSDFASGAIAVLVVEAAVAVVVVVVVVVVAVVAVCGSVGSATIVGAGGCGAPVVGSADSSVAAVCWCLAVVSSGDGDWAEWPLASNEPKANKAAPREVADEQCSGSRLARKLSNRSGTSL